jgi:hypothetical protein
MLRGKVRKIGSLLVLGLLTFGVVAARAPVAHAQTATQPVAQAQSCAADQEADGTEVKDAGADTDTVELQCGDQSGVDEAGESVSAGPDTDSVQEQSGDQNGEQIEDGQPDLAGAALEDPGN